MNARGRKAARSACGQLVRDDLTSLRDERAGSDPLLHRRREPLDVPLVQHRRVERAGDAPQRSAPRPVGAIGGITLAVLVEDRFVAAPHLYEDRRDPTLAEPLAQNLEVDRQRLAVRDDDDDATRGLAAEERRSSDVAERGERGRLVRATVGRRPLDADRAVHDRDERVRAKRRKQVRQHPVGKRRDADARVGDGGTERFASSRLRSRRVGSLGARRASMDRVTSKTTRTSAPSRPCVASERDTTGCAAATAIRRPTRQSSTRSTTSPRRPAGDRPSDEAAFAARRRATTRAQIARPTSRPTAAASGVRKLTDTSRPPQNPLPALDDPEPGLGSGARLSPPPAVPPPVSRSSLSASSRS